MQTTSFENDIRTSEANDNLKLEVLLMHDDLPAGLRGKQALDRVAAHLERNTEFSLKLWKFDLLNEPDLRQRALDDVRRANIVVLAVNGCAALPAAVHVWLKQWLQSRFSAPQALVVSLDTSAGRLPSPHPVLHDARAAAEPAGVDLFLHYSDTPRDAWNWTGQKTHPNVHPNGAPVWMERIAYLPEPHMAWGINE